MTSFPVVQTTHYLLIKTIKYAFKIFIFHEIIKVKQYFTWHKNSTNDQNNSSNEKKSSSNEQNNWVQINQNIAYKWAKT